VIFCLKEEISGNDRIEWHQIMVDRAFCELKAYELIPEERRG
jgi:hypothetical protein